VLRSPLRWVGGKYRVRDKIIAKFPPHSCYVELFSGAAWVLFGKPPETSKSEVLNDLDGELINFWRVVKHRSAEFTEAASWLLASRELFDEWKPLPGVSVLRLAYGAKRVRNHFGMRRDERPAIYWPLVREEVGKIVGRRLAWEKCLQTYDGSETFFYVDPPYRCDRPNPYRHDFSDEDHARLADLLLDGTKGRWLLSYNDDRFVRRLYRRRGVIIEAIVVRYGLQGGLWKQAREVLIRNY